MMGKAVEVRVGNQKKNESQLARDSVGSLEVFGQSAKKKNSPSVGVDWLCSESAWPDALDAAEMYLERIGQSAFLKLDVREVTSLFQALVEETGWQQQAPPKQRAPIEEVNQVKKWLAHANRSVSPVDDYINLEWGSEFSLDDSDCECDDAEVVVAMPVSMSLAVSEQVVGDDEDSTEHGMPSKSAEPERLPNGETIVTGAVESSPPERVLNEEAIRTVAVVPNSPNFPLLEEDQNEDIIDKAELVPKSTRAQLEEVFKGMMIARAEFQSGALNGSLSRKNSGVSSRTSSDSMSDEAITERASLWGNGVAKFVLKNSRETTPRNSDGSSRGSSSYTEDIPPISKHIKDALTSFQLAFLVCDATDTQIPILYASAGFFHMTGYSAEEVIGRNCRFLQGVDTDVTEVSRIRETLKKGEVYTGTLLNYKKDGTPFWNLLTLSPIKDDKGKVIKYIGMQAEVNSSRRVSSSAEGKEKSPSEVSSTEVHRPAWAVLKKASSPPKKPSINSSTTTVTPSRPPLFPQTNRSEREENIPVFSLPVSKAAAEKVQPRRASYGCPAPPSSASQQSQGRSRSRSSGSRRLSVRYSLSAGNVSAVDSRRSESCESRPLTWQAAVRKSAEELRVYPAGGLEEIPESTPPKESAIIIKNKTDLRRVGILRLFRTLHRKVITRQESWASTIPSQRLGGYDSDSDGDIDEQLESGIVHESDLESGIREQLRNIYSTTPSPQTPILI